MTIRPASNDEAEAHGFDSSQRGQYGSHQPISRITMPSGQVFYGVLSGEVDSPTSVVDTTVHDDTPDSDRTLTLSGNAYALSPYGDLLAAAITVEGQIDHSSWTDVDHPNIDDTLAAVTAAVTATLHAWQVHLDS